MIFKGIWSYILWNLVGIHNQKWETIRDILPAILNTPLEIMAL